jgi:hypothetical protein
MSCSSNLQCRTSIPWDLLTCSEGSCICTHLFGLKGSTCNIPSESSQGNAGILSVALTLNVLLISLCVMTLRDVIRQREIFQLNTAGRTYILSWVSFACSLVVSALSVGLTADRRLLPYMLAVDNFAVIFLLCAIISMTGAFFRFATVKVMKKKPFHKQKVTWILFALICLFVSLFFTVDWRIYSIIMFSFVAVVGCFGGFYPAVLFIRSMETNTTLDRNSLFRVAASEYFLRNGASARMMGFNYSIFHFKSSKRGSLSPQSSRLTEVDEHSPEDEHGNLSGPSITFSGSMQVENLPQMSTIKANDHPLATNSSSQKLRLGKSSKVNLKNLDAEKELGKAVFFFRLLHLGANILFLSIGVIAFWIAFMIMISEETIRPVSVSFSISAILWSLRSCCLVSINYSVISFTEQLYKKRARKIAEERALRRRTGNVQDLAGSEADIKAADIIVHQAEATT